jgi:hypothetical protein
MNPDSALCRVTSFEERDESRRWIEPEAKRSHLGVQGERWRTLPGCRSPASNAPRRWQRVSAGQRG